jgi:sortase A
VSWRHVLVRVGSVIFAFGVLVLLFVAYQLWGTGISTRFHQEALRKQFDRELAIARQDRASTTTTVAPSQPTTTTTTTQPLSGVAVPTPGVAPGEGQPVGTIVIPSIGVNYVVVQGTNTRDLQLGPGHYENTALPGQPGNAAIAGHRTTYLHPFYNLNELTPGQPIYVTTTQGRFQYNVSQVQVVSPSDLAVLDPTPVPTLTLTTCNPRFSAAQRLVVQATLVSPPAPVPTTTTTLPGHSSKPSPLAPGTADGLAGESGSAWSAIWWGLASVALAVVLGMVARERRRWTGRLLVCGIGALPLLALLFFFFQSVTPLLPASF